MLARTMTFQSPGNDNASNGDSSTLNLEDNEINGRHIYNEKESILLPSTSTKSVSSPTSSAAAKSISSPTIPAAAKSVSSPTTSVAAKSVTTSPTSSAVAKSLTSPTSSKNDQHISAIGDDACSNNKNNNVHTEASFENSIMSDILAYDLDDMLDNPNSSLLRTIELQASDKMINSTITLSSNMETSGNHVTQSNKQKKKKRKGNQKMKKVNLFDAASLDMSRPNPPSTEVIRKSI